MGASITMAKGAADAGLHPSLAVIGDSTFTHSGITGLLDCVLEHTPVTILILDNDTTAMTGGQNSVGMGGKLDRIVLGLGVDPAHFHVLDPLPSQTAQNAAVLEQELAHRGVSVIICRRVCIQAVKQRRKEASV
jgi:indolepyruvate ferredoxin oxidoreductase alpha subunit